MSELFDDLVTTEVALARGSLAIEQPSEVAQLPDHDDVQWAPIAPYWAVMWRSGLALAQELDRRDIAGLRVVELGCGLGLPSMAAARAGAAALATDAEAEGLALLDRNARANGVEPEILRVNWRRPEPLLARAPFDLLVAADVLYEEHAAAELASLIPRLAGHALIADPGRDGLDDFLGRVEMKQTGPPLRDGVVRIHELEA